MLQYFRYYVKQQQQQHLRIKRHAYASLVFFSFELHIFISFLFLSYINEIFYHFHN